MDKKEFWPQYREAKDIWLSEMALLSPDARKKLANISTMLAHDPNGPLNAGLQVAVVELNSRHQG